MRLAALPLLAPQQLGLSPTGATDDDAACCVVAAGATTDGLIFWVLIFRQNIVN